MDSQALIRSVLIAMEVFPRAKDTLDVKAPQFSLSTEEKVALEEIQEGILQAMMSDLETIEFMVMSDEAQTFAQSLISDLLDIMSGCQPENVAYLMRRLISVYLHLIANQEAICGEKVSQEAANLKERMSWSKNTRLFPAPDIRGWNIARQEGNPVFN